MNRDVSDGKKSVSLIAKFDLDFPSEIFQSTRPLVYTSLRFRRFHNKRVASLGQNPKPLVWRKGANLDIQD